MADTPFYFGSYTRLGGVGIGVCVREGDALRLVDTAPLPEASYLILDDARARLYAVSENKKDALAAAYAVDGAHLRPLSRQSALGWGLCHLCLSPDGRFLYTADYENGLVEVFPVTEEGLGERVQAVGISGFGRRNPWPHAHHVSFLPGTSWLCCVDLGLDAIMRYAQDARTGQLSFVDELELPAGWGPRHVVYGKPGIAYLVYELANRVSVLRYGADGRLTAGESLSTLPEDCRVQSAAAAVRLSPDGEGLWVSNRGYESLAAYAIDADGELSPLGHYPTGEANPRDFQILADGAILVAHQNGGLGLYRLGRGELARIGGLDVRGAVCVCV